MKKMVGQLVIGEDISLRSYQINNTRFKKKTLISKLIMITDFTKTEVYVMILPAFITRKKETNITYLGSKHRLLIDLLVKQIDLIYLSIS